jgi:hypothetical protein
LALGHTAGDVTSGLNVALTVGVDTTTTPKRRRRPERRRRPAWATVADLILTSTQKRPGTVVPSPSANKTANNGPQSDARMKEVKDERPAQ